MAGIKMGKGVANIKAAPGVDKIDENVKDADIKFDYDFVKFIDDKAVFDIKKMDEVITENYYDLATDRQYMNSTQYGNWLKCEAQEKARQDGKWQEEEKKVFVVGNYVHAWNDGTMEEFIDRYRDTIFKSKGGKYKDFVVADEVIVTLAHDEFIMYLLDSDTATKEEIFVAFFAGAWWKIRIDHLDLPKGRMIDIKTSGDFHKKVWDNERGKYVNFVEGYNYPRQMAIYEKGVREATGCDPLEVLIVAGEKKIPADKMVIDMTNHNRFEAELQAIEANMQRILKVKYGYEEPRRCGRCDYCKTTKQLDSTVYFEDIKF